MRGVHGDSRSAVQQLIDPWAEPSTPPPPCPAPSRRTVRPSGRASPERAGPRAGSFSGAAWPRRACSMAIPTATAIAAAPRPIKPRPVGHLPMTNESSAATVTVKSLVRSARHLVVRGGPGSGRLRPPPLDDGHITAGSSLRTRVLRLQPVVVPLLQAGGERRASVLQAAGCVLAAQFPLTTKPSGTPSISTAPLRPRGWRQEPALARLSLRARLAAAPALAPGRARASDLGPHMSPPYPAFVVDALELKPTPRTLVMNPGCCLRPQLAAQAEETCISRFFGDPTTCVSRPAA